MAEEQPLLPIIRTKLHVPAVGSDLVSRSRLHTLLDTALDRPLTLISAPAGYGKSMLVAHWIESREEPRAWLSLDEADGELTGFLRYVLAAIQELYPTACRETEGLLGGTAPQPAVLAGVLANELDLLEEPLLLVLDDYHRLDAESEVHELLRRLLHRPPRPLHLILVTRRDPSLSLASLRAGGRLTEVRLEDLRFTASETATLLEHTTSLAVGEAALTNLQRQFEGWAAGLRLAFLNLRHQEDPDRFLSELHGGFGAVQEYLVREVIESQPAEMRDWLLKTSVLDRFCADLCEVVCSSSGSSGDPCIDGSAFLARLRDANLFCISLDSEHEWFRYHHQFQTLLQLELERRYGAEEVAVLHSRASAWFAENGSIEEAIRHALVAGDVTEAVQLIERNRVAALVADRWYLLEKWLSLLPESETKRRPALLMARAWVLESRLSLAALPALLDEAEVLLGSDPEDEAIAGEVDYFHGYLLFFEGQAARSIERMEAAASRVPADHHLIAAELEVYGALAIQMEGRQDVGRRILEGRLADLDSFPPIRQTRILAGLVFVHLIADDLTSASAVNGLFARVADVQGNSHVQSWSCYTQGLVHFHRQELVEAEACFGRACQMRAHLHRRAVADAMVGLVLTREALGRREEADATLEQLIEYARIHADTACLHLAEACRQRLGVLRGESVRDPARRAEGADDAVMLFWLEMPIITHCRWLIAEGSPESLEEADRELRRVLAVNEEQHNTRQQIEALPLLALAQRKRGMEAEALALLERAVELATPGGSVRAFLEPGAEIAELLRRLPPAIAGGAGVRRILEASDRVGVAPPPAREVRQEPVPAAGGAPPMVEELTDRELEILELLAERFQNKEIAGRLFISTHTVNDHLKHIYQKLGVHGRRQAVARARALGLLGAR